MKLHKGLLLCSSGGLFRVLCEDGSEVGCTARGALRKKGQSPVAGDWVNFSKEEAVIQEILPRKNSLIRPPCANMDLLVLVISTTDPTPNVRVLDQLLVIAAKAEMQPVLVFTKGDLKEDPELMTLYRQAGYAVFSVNSLLGEGVEPLRAFLAGKTALMLGNSGVGKSTLLNALMPGLDLATGETSKKLGRGRHTTRCVTMYPFEGGFLADTPGFSTVDLLQYGLDDEEQLADAFLEFLPHLGNCRFADCAHIKEPGCAICAAVEAGEIAPSRHESYVAFYEELSKIQKWEKKQG